MMALVFCYRVLILLTLASAVHATSSNAYLFGDARNCSPNYKTIVHPGGGFDNLLNEDMESVFEVSYSKCQTTPDGKYLLPDNTFPVQVQQSNLVRNSEFFYHWDDYTDLTAASMNADNSFIPINGKFSKGYMEMKQHQINKKAKSTRAQVRHTFYTIKLETVAKLHQNFKTAVENIGNSVKKNNTKYAAYLAQLLIRDYGTHYTTSVDAGAVLAKTDYLGSSFFYKNLYNIHSILATADFFFISSGAQINANTLAQFEKQVKYSQIVALGGGLLSSTSNLTISDWERNINALVATDRAGRPLHYAISTLTLPCMPNETIRKVSELVKNATIQYYDANTFKGCTDPVSPNFIYQANVDDNVTCDAATTSLLGDYRSVPNFGGVYQTCKPASSAVSASYCNYLTTQKNPLTGDLSCPTPYTAIKLHEGIYYYNQKSDYKLIYQTYWCAWIEKSEPPDEGYLFGGFYTPYYDNVLTGNKTCPDFFDRVMILGDVSLCLSTDYEKGQEYAVIFGGFFSCSSGNPFAYKSCMSGQRPHKCPTGTTQHRMTIKDNCQISYCSAESDAMKHKSLTPIKRPPFNKQPDYPSSTNATRPTEGVCSNKETECGSA